MSNEIVKHVAALDLGQSQNDSFIVGRLSIPKRVVLFKLMCDIGFALAAAPLILFFSLALLILNPVLNPGPLFFSQYRMGKNERRFRIWKFRTMLACEHTLRAHDAQVEVHRITKFGCFVRQSRIDELPNFFNVLLGDMSVVGPRADAWDHAVVHIKTIPHYAHRFRLRPGITGLAQIRGGYADTTDAICRKARLDRIYVERFNLRLELHIILQTIRVMATGFGAK